MPAHRVVVAGTTSLLVVLAAFAGYQQIFSTYAEYDDEGYVMLSLASYLSGLPLYTETYSQYGPAFFQVHALLHRLTDLPVTHDVNRLRTLVVWLLAAVACGVAVRRMSASAVAGGGAALAVFFHLERLSLEPGHPQEFAVLAIATVIALSSTREPSHRTAARYVAMGVTTGVLLLTKLNLGIFLLLPIALTFLIVGPADRWLRGARHAAVAAALSLPFALTLWQSPPLSGMVLPTIVSLSIASSVQVASVRVGRSLLTWSDACWFLAGLGATCALSAALVLAQGTTLDALAYGLIGQHRSFGGAFYLPVPVPGVVVVWAVVATGAAFASRHRPTVAPWVRVVLAGALAYACVRYLIETTTPLVHGLNDRGGAGLLLGLGAPALWLLLLPTKPERVPSPLSTPSRLMLCLVAAVQPLGAFPVPGTQMAVSTMAILVAATVAVSDGIWMDRAWLVKPRVATVGLIVVLATLLVFRDVHLSQHRASLTPLDLPGAGRLRMEPNRVADTRWLVRTLRDHADTFVFGRHGRNSLYFWAEIAPPTGLNATFWPFLLNRDEQRRVVEALERPDAGRVAIVQTPFSAEFPEDSPLLRHIAEHYRPAHARGQLEVWLRNF